MRFNPDVLSDTERLIFALRTIYRENGYTQYRMGKFEEYDLYSRNKDFLVSDSVITFTDTNGKLMALKPDVTLSLIKNHKDVPGAVQKLCYDENIYRVSKGTNAFREIPQTGLECIGQVDTACVGEVLRLAAESLAVGGAGFVLEISQLDILSAFVDIISDNAAVRTAVLKCVGEKNLHGMAEICRENGIPLERTRPLEALLAAYGCPDQVLPQLRQLTAGRQLTAEVEALEQALGVFAGTPDAEKLRIDFSLVGDMNYYNGIIFKGFMDGIPGSVLSGGQYDKLMRRMGRRSRAVGFAVYLDMLDRLGSMKEAR